MKIVDEAKDKIMSPFKTTTTKGYRKPKRIKNVHYGVKKRK